jgi:FkbM family methyltransferase
LGLSSALRPAARLARWSRRRRIERAIQLLADRGAHGVVISVPELAAEYEMGLLSDITRRVLVYQEFEPQVTSVLHAVDDGRDFIDIGAHVGLHAVDMARRGGSMRRVLAVEPSPTLHGALRRNVDRAGVGHCVTIGTFAVGSTEGNGVLLSPTNMEEYGTLARDLVHPQAVGHGETSAPVVVRTIDTVVRDMELAPGLIKIDVEGAELLTLRGMAETLESFQPTLVFEFYAPLARTFGYGIRQLEDYFVAAGYCLTDLQHRRTHELNLSISHELLAHPC